MDERSSVEGLFRLARERAVAGDGEGAARTWSAAVSLAEREGLEDLIAMAESGLAAVDVRAGRLELAAERLAVAWARCEALHEYPAVRAHVGGQYGQVLVFVGRVAEGVQRMLRAVEEWRRAGDAAAAHELELAVTAVCERVERAVEEAVEPSVRIRALFQRAKVALAVGQADHATADLRALWLQRQGLTDVMRGEVAVLLSEAVAASGAPDASRHLLEAREVLSDLADEAGVCRIDQLLALVAPAGEA